MFGLCVVRPFFVGAECEAGLDAPPPLLGAPLDGALVAGADVSAGESLVARLLDGEDVSAGAAARAGEGALSSVASARAGVSAVVVVASVVESVDVESAAADVASSDEFICANLSPATAVNAAPAKNRAA
jgi:hypothetical protein